MCHNYKDYFNVWLDGEGILHVGPNDNMERVVLKHLEHLAAKNGLETVVVIETEVPIKLGAE